MAVLASNISGHLQNQLTRSLERILEDANQSGELKLSNRKLKDFPKTGSKYNLSDTVIAGKYRGAAHEDCNINYQDSRTIPVVFHNFSGYDSHFIIRDVSAKIPGRMSLIPNNNENFISFIKYVEDSDVKFKFTDSFRFMSSSLDVLSSYLDQHEIVRSQFPLALEEHLRLICRKGVFPYEYIKDWESLDEEQLPSIDGFYSKLNESNISPEEYEHAQKVWMDFGIHTLGEYSDLYLKTDVLLLAEVFEQFRENCIKNYNLDPAHYYTAPGLSWDAMLYKTKVELDYINDVDILMFLERGIRGGLTQCSKRHAAANNKYMKNFDPSKPTKYLMYYDINAMYASAMSKYLPKGGLKWMEGDTSTFDFHVPNNNPTGYILEVDLEYPKEIHDRQSDLPMAPKKSKPPGGKQEKMLATLKPKNKYVVHYRNLKQYVSEGLVVTKIHRVLQFNQAPWLKPYIDLNAELRRNSKNEFEKNLFKLMSNAVFGKTMENVRNRRDIKLITKWLGRYGAEARISSPNFHASKIIEEDLVLIELLKSEVLFNKPIYVGMSILDISKTLLYEFHYSYMKNKYVENCKLCYTDTDSLIYEIETEDIYGDIKKDIHRFDTSDYPSSNPYGIRQANKKVPGLMKDENNDLSKNRFSELPEEVTSFYFLERLHCYHNAIRYIPDTVGSLQCLSHLDLSRNQLTSLPREICQLPIQILLISNNRLASLPDELCRMYQLTELDASCNQLTHLPPRMGELCQLQSLVLRANLLLCVPIELTFLQLVRLDLRANRIGTLPVEMRDMHSLIELSVEDNPLSSPPASLCKRGRVHIFKYLENEAIKLGHKIGISGSGTLGRRPARRSVTSSNSSTPVPPSHIPERLKHKRQNVDSGYSTSSDDKRWSQEISGDIEKHWPSSPISSRASDLNGINSANSTPSTISPGPDNSFDEDLSKNTYCTDVCDKKEQLENREITNSVQISPSVESSTNLTNGNSNEEKSRPLQQIQTYREYKEALKQQRAQDVGAIYRTKDNEEHSYKTEPNTPTHQPSRTTLATSKSDPTPLNAALSSPKHIFDDTSPKKPVQKVTPSRNCNTFSPNHSNSNGNSMDNGKKFIQDYVKPNSPMKANSGILSHDNVPVTNGMTNGKPGSPRVHNSKQNGVKTTARSISWNKDMPPDKMTFTMRREIDKAREETDLINQLRTIIESRLKMSLPEDLAPTLTDGVVLCHLANHIKPRSVASIHVPSPAVPKLTMARCRRNVDNFLEACRKIGVDEEHLCSSVDVTEALEGRGLPRLLDTIDALCQLEETAETNCPPVNINDATVSLLLLAVLNLVCCSSDVLEGRGLVQVAITVTELLRFHSPRSPMHSSSLL